MFVEDEGAVVCGKLMSSSVPFLSQQLSDKYVIVQA